MAFEFLKLVAEVDDAVIYLICRQFWLYMRGAVGDSVTILYDLSGSTSRDTHQSLYWRIEEG
jgi:hypothetical protein